jgi:hypothetical protein
MTNVCPMAGGSEGRPSHGGLQLAEGGQCNPGLECCGAGEPGQAGRSQRGAAGGRVGLLGEACKDPGGAGMGDRGLAVDSANLLLEELPAPPARATKARGRGGNP